MRPKQSFFDRIDAAVTRWFGVPGRVERAGMFERFMDDRVWRLSAEERGEVEPSRTNAAAEIRFAQLRASLRSCNAEHRSCELD